MHDGAAGRRRKIDNAHDALTPCPHVDRDDQRCGSRFNLGRLDQAFSVCFGSYRGCPMYHRINNELQRRHTAARLLEAFTTPIKPVTPVIAITHHGRAVPLRPTGT